MYWILFVMGGIAAIGVALVIGGLATPRHHEVARSMTLPVTPDRLWMSVRDIDAYGQWRHELEDVERVDTDQAQPRWRETNTRRSLTFGVTRDEPPHRFSASILDDDLPYTGEWTWIVEPHGTGARVTITERGSVLNPIYRFIGAHFIGYTRSLDRYLASLAAHHGAPDSAIADATPT